MHWWWSHLFCDVTHTYTQVVVFLHNSFPPLLSRYFFFPFSLPGFSLAHCVYLEYQRYYCGRNTAPLRIILIYSGVEDSRREPRERRKASNLGCMQNLVGVWLLWLYRRTFKHCLPVQSASQVAPRRTTNKCFNLNSWFQHTCHPFCILWNLFVARQSFVFILLLLLLWWWRHTNSLCYSDSVSIFNLKPHLKMWFVMFVRACAFCDSINNWYLFFFLWYYRWSIFVFQFKLFAYWFTEGSTQALQLILFGNKMLYIIVYFRFFLMF